MGVVVNERVLRRVRPAGSGPGGGAVGPGGGLRVLVVGAGPAGVATALLLTTARSCCTDSPRST
jgi:NADPH-dependent glutamate synthase beta subunit-like oxidoreductase